MFTRPDARGSAAQATSAPRCLGAALALLCVLAGAACGCDRPGADAARPELEAATTLRIAINSPRSLDPNLVSESEGGMIVENTFEGLYVPGPEGNAVRPGVARTCTSADQRVWRCALREDARWSDGQPVTAHDFVYSWRRLLDPKTASEYTSIMKPIEGAEALTGCLGDAAAQGVDPQALCAARREALGVEAIDDHTLEVTLAQPYPLFRELVAFYSFLPVPRHVLERVVDGTPLGEGSRWTQAEHWVSNGPYVMVSRENRVEIVLAKNPHYWDREAVAIPYVQARIIEDWKARFAAYLAGNLDILEDTIPGSELRKRWISGSPTLRIDPRLGVYMLVFNTRQAPFDDPRVRCAFYLATDRGELVKYVTGGGEVPASGLVPTILGALTAYETAPGGLCPADHEGPARAYDPERARALLAAAGYPGGRGLGEVVYSYNTDENHKKVAESIAQMWKRELGVEVALNNMEWKVYLDQLKGGEFQIGRYGWIADYVDPMTFLDLFESDNPNNSSDWHSAAFDALIDAARAEGDAAARFALMREAEALLMTEVPVLPLYYYSMKLLLAPRVEGVGRHLLGTHLFKYIRLGATP